MTPTKAAALPAMIVALRNKLRREIMAGKRSASKIALRGFLSMSISQFPTSIHCLCIQPFLNVINTLRSFQSTHSFFAVSFIYDGRAWPAWQALKRAKRPKQGGE